MKQLIVFLVCYFSLALNSSTTYCNDFCAPCKINYHSFLKDRISPRVIFLFLCGMIKSHPNALRVFLLFFQDTPILCKFVLEATVKGNVSEYSIQ